MEATDVFNYESHPFQTSTLTLNEYLRKFKLLSDIDQHKQSIQACIARCTNGGFIVKNLNTANGSPIYRVVTIKEMSERLCESTHFTIQCKTEVPSKNGTSTMVVKQTTIKFSPMNYLREGEDDAYPLARYHDVALMSRTEGVLSLYIPPKHKDASDEFALKFINQMRTRFYNPEAFIEELRAHAYRLRYPDAHIEELFIHYSSESKNLRDIIVI